MRVQRNERNAVSSSESTSWPSNRTLPPVITAGGGRMRNSACASVDLPLPDSPAIPMISPRATSSDR